VPNDAGQIELALPIDFEAGSDEKKFYFVMLPTGASDFAIGATRKGPAFTIKGKTRSNKKKT
jgi:hypothetical protein